MLFAAGAIHLFFLYLQNIKDFSLWRTLILSLFSCLWLLLQYGTVGWLFSAGTGCDLLWFSIHFVSPGISPGWAVAVAVTERCSRWVFQQSSSSCYLPPTWCSILTMPAVNWGLPSTIFIQFIPIMQLCCREIIVLFLELLHISFAFSSLVFSIDVFHVLLGFFSPLNHFFFILHLIPAAQCCWGRGCPVFLAVCVMPA